MSADPFRDIVKQYAKLYRDAEESKYLNAQKRGKEYIEWKIEKDIYEKALNALKFTEENESKKLQ